MSTKQNPYNDQIMRLSSLQKFPMYPQGITELREALRRGVGTMDRAERVIDRVVGERETCPTPRELTVICEEVIRASEAAPSGCEICNGHPWVSVSRRVIGPDRVPYMADGAKRCDCSKGQWFQSKDRENKQKRDAGLPV